MKRRIFYNPTVEGLLRFTLAAVATLLLSNCNPALHQGRMYEGPPLSINKICMITPASAQIGGMRIVRIAGQPVRVAPSDTIELLPRKYSLEVTIDIEFFLTGYRQKVLSRKPVAMDFVCEQGNVYLVNYSLDYDENQYTWDWKPFIENITSRPDVRKYIQEREDNLEQSEN